MKNKIKVVWICGVSNPKLRSHLDLRLPWWHTIIRRLFGRNTENDVADSAIWNTNALQEFETIENVELHVIFSHLNMRKKYQEFSEGGIRYYAVNAGDTSLRTFISWHFGKRKRNYKQSHKTIVNFVKKISPDIIHIIGAENPRYSLALLQIPKNIPVITQLQTLLCDPNVEKQGEKIKQQQKDCERKVLLKTNYIGTKSKYFPPIIREQIRKDAVCVNTSLCIAEKVDTSLSEKKYDFVYFANNINKAIDLAIESFALACKKHPDLTLDVIGGVSEEEKQCLLEHLDQLGIRENVIIEGKLPTHDDVLIQIKKAHFALLPIKGDYVSGTIREAMSNGLPVVTTITQGTPILNAQRETVLLSEIGDHQSLADNMIKIVENPQLADTLRTNGFLNMESYVGNRQRVEEWVKVYLACIDNFHNGTTLPEYLVNHN